MLAIIIGLCSLFSVGKGSQHKPTQHLFQDTVKRNSHAVTDTVGHFVEINRIFIIGNRITRDQIVLRELSLKKGDIVYSTDLARMLDLDRKKLINTRLFNKVDIRTLELDATKIDLLIDLNERWYTFPAPIFELADRNFNEWWQNYNHDFKRINYGLKLYQFNMRGRNETLRLIAQFGFQRRFELQYRFPYIDKRQKHGLSLDVGYSETKNLAYKTEDHKYVFMKSDTILRDDRFVGLTYTYRKSFYKTHSFKVEYRDVHVHDMVKQDNPDYIKGEQNNQQRYGWATYMFVADHRDFFAYPLKGFQLIAAISKTGLTPADDVNKVEANFQHALFVDLKKKYYFSNNVIAYWSNPDNLSYVNYGVLGLKKQFVRGYEIYVIEGPYYLVNKATFKKLIFSNIYHWGDMPLEQFRHIPLAIYLKTYADLGYVRNYPDYIEDNRNTRLSDKLIAGTGAGLDIVGSYDIVLRLEYSFNAEGENGFFFHLKKEF